MSVFLAILIVWFLISIVAGLLISRVFASAHDGASTGRGTPQRLTSQNTRAVKDTAASSF